MVLVMAFFAGSACGAKLGEGREDGAGEGVEGHADELLHAGHLGVDVVGGSAADVALGAIDVRVGRVLVGDPLGLHGDVAGGAAKARRVHVGDAAVTGDTDDHKVDEGRDDHEVQGVAEHRIIEVDLGIDGGEFALGEEFPPLEEDADRDHDQPEDKEGGQEEKENQADVGVR